MRIIKILLCTIAIPFLTIGLYQFVNRYADWQDSNITEQNYLDRIEELEEKRDILQEYIEKIESDRFTQERLVRRFGYVKPGEVVYQIETKQRIDGKKEDESYLSGLLLEDLFKKPK